MDTLPAKVIQSIALENAGIWRSLSTSNKYLHGCLSEGKLVAEAMHKFTKWQLIHGTMYEVLPNGRIHGNCVRDNAKLVMEEYYKNGERVYEVKYYDA
jgi:antitoxin component YwqK of YwqJK toxin-antitoxin module